MPDPADRQVAILGTLISGAQVYSAFLPSVFTIRHFGADPKTVRDIRDGERVATAILLATAVILAGVSGTNEPIWVAVVISTVMIAVYEWALRTRHGTAEAQEAD